MNKNLSRKGLYPFLERQYEKIRPNDRVLSVGAGGGVNRLLAEYASENGFDVIEFDIDSERDPDIQGDICTYDFEGKTYDVVVFCEVLEHVHSPHLAVQNLYKILNEEGRLILTVPFMLPIHESPHDYYRYTRYGLEFLLRDFDEVVIKERNSYFEAIDVLYIRYNRNVNKLVRAFSDVLTFVAYLKLPITRLLSMLANTDEMTTGYTVTAVKPAASDGMISQEKEDA